MRGVTHGRLIDADELKISTHTPHARRDAASSFLCVCVSVFLLTRLMRGVTGGLVDNFSG